MNARTGWMILALAALTTTACGTPSEKDALTKSEAQALVESGDADDSICADNDFNDDDECDDWCPDGDENDCAVSNMCTDGETKDADDGCNTCECIDGGWACTEIACNVNSGTNNNNGGPTPIQIGSCPADGGDMFELNTVEIKGDILSVETSFSGGCEEHEFTACWDGSFLESFPVQARLMLHHNANGDACEAYLTQSFSFDLTPMKESYQEGYQSETGTIILGVDDDGVDYTF